MLQFFKPENYFEVREALLKAGRQDLIGDDCDSLIPSRPPREAIAARRKDANDRFRGAYVHSDDRPPNGASSAGTTRQSRNAPGTGYRPKRASAQPKRNSAQAGPTSGKRTDAKKQRRSDRRP